MTDKLIIIPLSEVRDRYGDYIEQLSEQTHITLDNVVDTVIEQSNQKDIKMIEGSLRDLSISVIHEYDPDLLDNDELIEMVIELIEALIKLLENPLLLQRRCNWHFYKMLYNAIALIYKNG